MAVSPNVSAERLRGAFAIATIHGDPGYREPILQTTLDGLRPPNHGGAT